MNRFKKSKLVVVLIWAGLYSYNGISQQTDSDISEENYLNAIQLQLNQNPNLLLRNQNPEFVKNIQSLDNFVNLNQIGNYNNIDIKQKDKDSQIVTQLGNKNYYNFISYYNNSASSKFNIVQKGNSNALHIYGENSIIKNISIVQKSNFKTLVIRNY